MVTNKYDTTGKYCPLNGFSPPCGLCMWAVEDMSGNLTCSIALIAQDSTWKDNDRRVSIEWAKRDDEIH